MVGLQGRDAATPFLQAFEIGLRGVGHTPGRTLVFEYHSAEGRPERVGPIVTAIARQPTDVIVATTTDVILAAKRATTTIPIVMAVGGDPVSAGLVATLAHPGGNVTGLTFDVVPDVYGKPLEFLKEAMPRLNRVAVLRTSDVTFKHVAQATTASAARLGLTLTFIEVNEPAHVAPALAAVKRDGIPAVLVWPNGAVYGARRQLIEQATRDGVVVVSIVRQFTDEGALLSYGPNVFDLFRRSAIYVDKILKGAKPSDLPVEQPTEFELVINVKSVKALGLTLPQALLLRADSVIQ